MPRLLEGLPRQLLTSRGNLDYLLIRSPRRRTLAVHIHSQNQVKVFAPHFLSDDKILAFLREKIDWIFRKMQDVSERLLRYKKPAFKEGEEFLFLGKLYRLWVESNGKTKPQLTFDPSGWKARVSSLLTAPDQSKVVRNELTMWYQQQAGEILGSRVFHFSRLMGLEPLKIAIRSQKTIWGSCHSRHKSIHLNWKLIMAPVNVIDYVVVHELSHLKVPNHSKRFWREVAKVLPDYRSRQQWLKENSTRMRFE